ncbi:hypothetical protein C1879_06650 [Paraeggerthella hongkongensis]|uniref:hypothetical protein n=1 Tax=unclassified Paraeggerthella TaxID=2641972 RepID=UPI000DF7EE67|nr:hypothetical protein [Paraeggerthella sp.]RDB57902.1 hypothetical protein C1879_06650 [Paraeggerthella hongkongensis]
MTNRNLPDMPFQGTGPQPHVGLPQSERHLPNRTHGIRFDVSLQRPTADEARDPFATVRPATPDLHRGNRPPSAGTASMRILSAIFAIVAVGAVGTIGGTLVSRGIAAAPEADSVPAAESAPSQSVDAAGNSTAPAWKKASAPALFQNDPAWSSDPYGSGTIGSSGGAPLCLAMARIGVTGDTDMGPSVVAAFARSNGYVENPDGLLTEGARQLGLKVNSVESSELAIRKEITAGRPVIASLDSDSSASKPSYVVLVDIDRHGMLVVNDPKRRDHAVHSRSFNDVVRRANALWSYQAAPASKPASS